jgi:RNA polymerase sigma factor (sigma-70 family)
MTSFTLHTALISESLVWLWEHLGELPCGSDGVALLQRAWQAVGANWSRAERRRRRRQRRYAELKRAERVQAPPSDAELLEVEWRRVLDETLAALPSALRDAVVGHFLDGQTWETVANQLGCTERNARRLSDHALDILRGWLEGRV